MCAALQVLVPSSELLKAGPSAVLAVAGSVVTANPLGLIQVGDKWCWGVTCCSGLCWSVLCCAVPRWAVPCRACARAAVLLGCWQ
jgi:hypothetical protein